MGGFRRKTRYKLTKEHKDKGKVTITRMLQQFKEGEKVTLVLEPAVHEGAFYPRFQGRHGIVEGKRGNCYIVKIKDLNKTKSMIIHPVHLRRD